MEKKETRKMDYCSPLVKVIYIEQQSMLCTSDMNIFGEYGGDADETSGGIINRN